MEHSESYEELQKLNPGGTSHFSEEDLPSNLIGFYMATQMFYHGASYEVVLQDILDRCDVLKREESLNVYEKEYQNGAGFVTGWRSWQARLCPLTQTCARCTFGYRAWPGAFLNLASLAIHSERNSTWWWWQSNITDGDPKATDVEGVFALEEYTYPYPLP